MASNFFTLLFVVATPLLVTVTPRIGWAQATAGLRTHGQQSLPGAIRYRDRSSGTVAHAQHLAPIAHEALPGAYPIDGESITAAPTHRVIRSPDLRPSRRHSHGLNSHGLKHKSAHPPHFSRHHGIQPPPALVPQARQEETWKAPFSYGYFGASGTRHWSLHYGYRDRYTEWRFR